LKPGAQPGDFVVVLAALGAMREMVSHGSLFGFGQRAARQQTDILALFAAGG